jgi:hypothetical protein
LTEEQKLYDQQKQQQALPQVRHALEQQRDHLAHYFDAGVLDTATPEVAHRIMQIVEIHADAYKPLNTRLTKEYLAQQGLAPSYEVRNRETTMWFSKPYKIADRDAVVAYVIDTDGKVVARSYYKSTSQEGWRYLPSYTVENGQLGWFSKGHQGGNAEESLDIPFSVQKHLDTITQKQMIRLQPHTPELIFAGTAREKGQRQGPEVAGTYGKEVWETPMYLEGNFYAGHGKVPPEQADFTNDAQRPDYSQKLATWQSWSPMYGDVTKEIYVSKDRTKLYLWCRDAEGGMWRGGAEAITSPMLSTGLRQQWIKGGDFSTPRFEYADHDGGYGNKWKRKNKWYVDMQGYIDRMPDTIAYKKSLAA